MVSDSVRLAKPYNIQQGKYHCMEIGFMEKWILVNYPKDFLLVKKNAFCLSNNRIQNCQRNVLMN